MATRGGVVAGGSKVFGAARYNRVRGGIVKAGPIASASGIFNLASGLKTLKSWLPRTQIEFAHEKGGKLYVTTEWYRFFEEVAKRLGGIDGPKVTDVQQTAVVAQAAVVNVVTAVNDVVSITNANADSINTTVQVSQNNNLTGAQSIPPAKRASYLNSNEIEP